jgi:pilus assembly protein CpaC
MRLPADYLRMCRLTNRLFLLILIVSASAASPPDPLPTLTLTVGKALVVDSPVKIKRIASANSDLVEIVMIGPREVLVNGKQPGETSLIVWLENDTRITYDLLCAPVPTA